LLGVDASTLALARAGKLEFPKWWEDIFGDSGDESTCADAYREARVFFELGEPESSKNAKSKRHGNLAWIAAADAVEFSKIPKRRRKDRLEWIAQLSFFLGRVAAGLTHPKWKRLVDSGVVEFKGRASGDGERIQLTDKGRKYLAGDRGDFGRAWSFCESACEWYLCSMVMRLRGIYGDTLTASRRRDVLAALLANEESGREERRQESERTTILQMKKFLPDENFSRGLGSARVRSIVAKDSKVIRDVAKAHQEDAERRRNPRAKPSKK